MKLLMTGKSGRCMQIKSHSHEIWEIVANLQGFGIFCYGGREIPFQPGSIVCIPPGVSHSKQSEQGYRDLWIWTTDFILPERRTPVFLQENGDYGIISMMRILYSVQHRKIPNADAVSGALLNSIEQMILSYLKRSPFDTSVEQITDLIVRNFQDPDFSLGACLSGSGYCPDHMRRLFRKETGKTPHEYLMDLRIKSAKNLLISRKISNYTISEIATFSGFRDATYFCRAFKKATGRAPAEYEGK